jgi:hypothetical protein
MLGLFLPLIFELLAPRPSSHFVRPVCYHLRKGSWVEVVAPPKVAPTKVAPSKVAPPKVAPGARCYHHSTTYENGAGVSHPSIARVAKATLLAHFLISMPYLNLVLK